MDVLFEVLLPELEDVEGLEPHQVIFSWGGEAHPQGPVTYRWGPHVELAPDYIQPHIMRFLPEGYADESWAVLQIKGDGLDLLEMEVNGEEVDWFGRRLDDLLESLLKQHERWVLIFEPNYDQIDRVYELDVEECISKLKANLRRDAGREGFIAIASRTKGI